MWVLLKVAALWWVLFFAAVGLAIGSYLNVVIYRIPRGLATTDPLWSFCPRCRYRIHWYDNLPVLSYLRLGGRCRNCGGLISPQYAAIELLMATLVLVILDAFCVAGLRSGNVDLGLGITEQLYYDWPIVLAHIILFACLLAMSVIDLEHYFIDIRFTNFALLAGFVLHAIWSPSIAIVTWQPTVGQAWHHVSPVTGIVGLAAAAGALLTWLVTAFAFRPRLVVASNAGNGAEAVDPPAAEPAPLPAATSAEHDASAAPETAAAAEPSLTAFDDSRLAHAALWIVAMVALVALLSTTADAVWDGPRLLPVERLWVPIAACFVLIVGAGAPVRESDTAIIDAIESERFSARLMAARELLWLLAPIATGATAGWLYLRHEPFQRWCDVWWNWSPHGSWHPLAGLANAAAGYVVAAAVGWGVRIVFTLVLGREAFGTGDIHLMAATGCVAGWPVVALGFVLTSFLALAGWLVTLPFKRTRAIPLVPWLSLAFLIVVVFYDRLAAWGPVQNTVVLFEAVTSGKLTGPLP